MGILDTILTETDPKIKPPVEKIPTPAPGNFDMSAMMQAARDHVEKSTALKPVAPVSLADAIQKPAPVSLTEAIVAQTAPIKIELPTATTVPSIPEKKVVIPKSSNPEEMSGRELLNKLLPEIQEFFDLNKDLVKKKNELEDSKSEGERKNNERDILVSDAKQIDDALQALMLATGDEETGVSLNTAVTAFKSYQTELEKKISKEKNIDNSESNKILIALNGINVKLKKITELFGGEANQKKIIATVETLRGMMDRYMDKEGLNYSHVAEFLVGKLFTNFNIAREQAFARDPEICMELASEGKILELFTLFVQQYVQNETPKTNK